MDLDQLIEKLLILKEQGFGEVPVYIVNDNTLLTLEEVGEVVLPQKGREEIAIVLESE